MSVPEPKLVKGTVISDASDKTIVVLVERLVAHPKYGKYLKRKTKLHVHDPKNEAKAGDVVNIKSVRPISKKKTWELVSIVR